jgi:HTH-type transcriptional regulator/antitoxin HigA
MAKKMIRPVRNETDYDEALEEIERYFESELKPGTPEADRFDLLALVIEDYERKQADLGRLLGSRQRASDVLTKKRPLTMKMAWKLHREWSIPAQALIVPPAGARTKVCGVSA